MHNTPSDHRSLANDMAGLRRIGLTHPLDSKPLVMEAGEGYAPNILKPIQPRIDQRVRQHLHSLGWPLTVTTRKLHGVVAPATAEKALYQIGYRITQWSSHPGQANIWGANAEITGWHEELLKNHPVNSTPDVEVKLREEAFDSGPAPDLNLKVREEPAVMDERREFVVEPKCGHNSWEQFPGGGRKCDDCGEILDPILVPREPEPGPEKEHVDYIDERDSWVIDMEDLFGEHVMRIMKEKLNVLTVVGMDYELRVWRKK